MSNLIPPERRSKWKAKLARQFVHPNYKSSSGKIVVWRLEAVV
jgi:hypothetical protein